MTASTSPARAAPSPARLAPQLAVGPAAWLRRHAAKLLAVPALAALAACQTATPYQPLGIRGTGASGGFAEQRIEADRWRVSFAGNTLTSRERVETYLLYRAAELTLQNGYDSFTIVDRVTDRDVQTRVTRDPLWGDPWGYGGFWRPSWSYYGRGYGWRSWDPWYGGPFWANDIDVRTYQRFEASAEIVLRRGAGSDRERSFNAREVVDNLRPRIELPRER